MDLLEKAIELLKSRISSNDMMYADVEPLQEIINENDNDLQALIGENSKVDESDTNSVVVDGKQYDPLSGFIGFSTNVCISLCNFIIHNYLLYCKITIQ